MTKDSPNPSGGSRATPKKLASPGPTASMLEEQKRELEKLRAELEEERARGRAERRRWAAEARQLREAEERERQLLADHLRSQWEAQRCRELRQLQEKVLREREAEIRQLLRWKEAEMRQLQQLLHRERDGVVRQARELQSQLAAELVNRGYCGRAGAPRAAATGAAAAQCRCRLQEVLAQLRWETHGEQASRIRHLQAALDVERQLFLKYVLEHSRWQPVWPGTPDPQAVHSSSEEPHPQTAGDFHRPPRSPQVRLEVLDGLGASVRVRSRSLEVVPAACSSSLDSLLLPTRSGSLQSLAPARSHSLDSILSRRPKAPESEERASSADTFILGFLSPPPLSPSPPPPQPLPPPLPSSQPRAPGDRTGEDPGSQPCEALVLSPLSLEDQELVKQNAELSEALQVLARRCSDLLDENMQLRRARFPDQEADNVKRLKGKHAELTGLARRLEDRARKLQETNLRALSAPVPGESSRAGLELCQAFARQRARDLSEQASALLAKDKQIEELQHECHLLQTHVASGLGSAPHPHGGAASAQWLKVSDLDRLQRESQREVLRLQRQLTLQRAPRSARSEPSGRSAPREEARGQVQALERGVPSRRQECQELRAQAAAAQRRRGSAEAAAAAAQLQTALCKGAWLAKENARLQAQAAWTRKLAAENDDVREQLGRACQERGTTGLLVGQLLQQAARGRDKQQQLQRDLQEALRDLEAAREELRVLQSQPGRHPQKPPEASQAPDSHGRKSRWARFQPGPEDQASPRPSGDKQEGDAPLRGSPVALWEPASAPQGPDRVPASQPLDRTAQAKKPSSRSNSSSEVESMWATVPSCLTLDVDTASEVDDLDPDSVPLTLEAGDPEAPTTAAPKLKVFLVRYSYNPFEGPNEHPESELPLTAGDCVYVFGEMDEDGFYQGELEDGRRGLVPSNLVVPIPDSDVLGGLAPEASDPGPARLPAGQGRASKEDIGHSALPGEAQGAVDGETARPMARAASKTEAATEISDARAEDGWLASPQGVEEQGPLSRSLLGPNGVPCVAPKQLRLQNVAATSAGITWVCSSRRWPHVVYLNGQRHALTPAGVSGYAFRSLHPSTRYRVQVEVQLPWDSTQERWETASPTLTFDTPVAGPPDPPLDVLVEPHASPGLLVVSWLPVTIDLAGFSNGVRVTGYAVYAEGLKVAEVTDATAGSTLLERSQLMLPRMCQKVSVRTVSLCGESLDSVPAQIPQDCLDWDSLPETSPFTYPRGDQSPCTATFPVRPQGLAPAPPGAKASSHVPRSCGEPLEAFPEEPPMPDLSLEGECPGAGAGSQTPGPAEAWGVCRKGLLSPKSPQNHRPPLRSDQSQGQEGRDRHMDTSRSSALGVLHLSPGRGAWREKAALDKVLRQKQDAQVSTHPQTGTRQPYTSGFHDILQQEEEEGEEEEEALCSGPWTTERQEQRRELRTQSRRGQALRGKRDSQLREPSSALCPASSSKAIAGGPPLREAGPDALARVYEPLVMSTEPEAAEDELAFQKGQLLRVWGSRDSRGFYRGECHGQVGNIPGHLEAEVEEGVERTDRRWHLPAQGHLPSVDRLDEIGGLPIPQDSFLLPQGDPRRPPPCTRMTMMAALDYDPKDGWAGGQVKGKLSLKAGDLVTVYGPVDDRGFYYGESGGRRGLVPAHLLDYMSLHDE